MENIHRKDWTIVFITVVGTLVKVYIFTVVYIWQSVLSALNKEYHLSMDCVVPNGVYSTCNKIHHIQCLTHTEVNQYSHCVTTVLYLTVVCPTLSCTYRQYVALAQNNLDLCHCCYTMYLLHSSCNVYNYVCVCF